MEGKLVAICLSEAKGTAKKAVPSGWLVVNHGLQDDAHAGNWHRQVSLLSWQKVVEFNQKGAAVDHGDFGENLLVDGIDLRSLPVGTRLAVGSALLEVTQIGKQCHSHCQIFHRVGDCVMPREGIFAKVLTGGEIKTGDIITTTSQ
ncbi:MAG: MOSC domain-containing protein [Deltaproteobacteria bacterium]|jgi:MOSC domain-containing protein YiiM|nr:MOSC domain-containing protein [Deltaproteobacteria bacterium]